MFLHYAKMILEITRTSTIRRSKLQKRNAYQGRASINIAKDKNKALYNKYARKRMEYMRLKQQMARQYKSAAAREARKKIR